LVGNFTDVYDPATDSWTTKTTIPILTAHSANAEVDGKIYVVSGNHWGNDPQFFMPINLLQIYDPQTDSWSAGTQVPVGVASAAAVATSGADAPKAIYVVGGLTLTSDSSGNFTYHPQKLVQVYYPANDSWSSGADMPTARYALAACILSDRVYAMGGSDARESPDLASNELYLPLGYGAMTQPGVPQAILIGAVIAVVVVVVIVVAWLSKRTKKGSRVFSGG
jgi:N-acetylneuraminic acid mutarotase